jgi:polyhydroxybutyrate depolymerase
MKTVRVARCVSLLASLALVGCASGADSSGTGGQPSTGEGGKTTSGGGGTAGMASGKGGAVTTGEGGAVSSGKGGAIATGEGGAVSSGKGGATTTGEGGATATGEGGTTTATGKGGAVGAGQGGAGPAGSGGKGSAGTTGTAGAGAAGSTGGGSCPKSSLKVGDNNVTITSGGESRTFIVRLPTGYTGTSPVPAIIDFHPLGGSGSSQEGSSGWKAKCDSVGCIGVWPDSSKSKASDNSWNAGYCCTNAEKNKVDDVQFARDIVKYLQDNTCVDSKKIYASGGSNGGGMTYRMACEAADVIAAAAPVDFRCVTGTDPLATTVSAANQTACKCNLPRPITIVAWDEKADTSIVPYGGGQTPSLATDCPPGGSCVGIGFASAQVNAQIWADFDKCSGSAAQDPNNSLCQIWSTCDNGTTVSLCSTTSGGHLAVYSNSGAKFTDTAWNILKTQSLP